MWAIERQSAGRLTKRIAFAQTIRSARTNCGNRCSLHGRRRPDSTARLTGALIGRLEKARERWSGCFGYGDRPLRSSGALIRLDRGDLDSNGLDRILIDRMRRLGQRLGQRFGVQSLGPPDTQSQARRLDMGRRVQEALATDQHDLQHGFEAGDLVEHLQHLCRNTIGFVDGENRPDAALSALAQAVAQAHAPFARTGCCGLEQRGPNQRGTLWASHATPAKPGWQPTGYGIEQWRRAHSVLHLDEEHALAIG